MFHSLKIKNDEFIKYSGIIRNNLMDQEKYWNILKIMKNLVLSNILPNLDNLHYKYFTVAAILYGKYDEKIYI